jgi:hypothetical protein
MRPSLKAIRTRFFDGAATASERAHAAAEGAGGPPAGEEPAALDEQRSPGAVERGTMRRRLRRARRLRETLMTELGALVMEMHRQDRHDRALVERKAREALVADREANALARALRDEMTLHEVYAAGIAGPCHRCGALVATDDRFCARCGARAIATADGAAPAERAARSGGGALTWTPVGASAPPPDPSTREQGAAVPGQAAPPPPDPTTRVPAAGSDPGAARMTPGPTRG